MLFRLNFILQTNVRFKVHGNGPFTKINVKYEEWIQFVQLYI